MIRRVQEKDRAVLRKMLRDFYASPAVAIHCSDEIVEKNLDAAIGPNPQLQGVVFEEDGRIVGYALMTSCYNTEFGGQCVWLEELCIEPGCVSRIRMRSVSGLRRSRTMSGRWHFIAAGAFIPHRIFR